MVRSLFGNSSWKLRSMSWGCLFILVCTNQTEMLLTINLPIFLVPAWFHTHGAKIRALLDSNHNGCGNRLPLWFWHPNQIFLSKGKHPRYSTLPTGRNEILKINFFHLWPCKKWGKVEPYFKKDTCLVAWMKTKGFQKNLVGALSVRLGVNHRKLVLSTESKKSTCYLT